MNTDNKDNTPSSGTSPSMAQSTEPPVTSRPQWATMKPSVPVVISPVPANADPRKGGIPGMNLMPTEFNPNRRQFGLATDVAALGGPKALPPGTQIMVPSGVKDSESLNVRSISQEESLRLGHSVIAHAFDRKDSERRIRHGGTMPDQPVTAPWAGYSSHGWWNQTPVRDAGDGHHNTQRSLAIEPRPQIGDHSGSSSVRPSRQSVVPNLQLDVQSVLSDIGVEKYDPTVAHQLMDFVQREVFTLLELASQASSDPFANVAAPKPKYFPKSISKEDAALAVRLRNEELQRKQDNSVIARDVNKLSLGRYPQEHGLHLPPDALVAAVWHLTPKDVPDQQES